MKRILAAGILLAAVMPMGASAQMTADQSFAVQGNCGQAIQQYCPQVDQQSFDALWQCLSPVFDKIDPMCKVTLQEIQNN
jgi:hypothetical protein